MQVLSQDEVRRVAAVLHALTVDQFPKFLLERCQRWALQSENRLGLFDGSLERYQPICFTHFIYVGGKYCGVNFGTFVLSDQHIATGVGYSMNFPSFMLLSQTCYSSIIFFQM